VAPRDPFSPFSGAWQEFMVRVRGLEAPRDAFSVCTQFTVATGKKAIIREQRWLLRGVGC
jgi:hypothetical protein